MKKIFTIFILTLSFINAKSQQCGTGTNFPNKLPTYNYLPGDTYDASPLCVKVFFHIVRNSAGTNGFSVGNIQSRIDYLNQVYNPLNILIVNAGQDFINDDTYGLEFNDGEFNSLVLRNVVANAVNIYLLPVDVSGSLSYSGKASGIPGTALVVANTFILQSTLPHELGHCLNLFHTHHQVESSGCDETASGKNCSTCGDFVCDTPIDPVLSCGGNVNPTTCAYVGGGIAPLTNNIMSYSCKSCRDRFTSGQGLRMRISLNNDNVIKSVANTGCITLTGSNPVCNSDLYTVNNSPVGTNFSWSKVDPYNIATLTPSSSTCTVTGGLYSNGTITLICSLITPTGTLFISKDIVMGKGLNSINYTYTEATCVSSRGYFYGNIKPVPGASNYQWYSKDLSNISNQYVYKDGGFGFSNIDFPLGPGGRDYAIKVVVTTPCGSLIDESFIASPPVCTTGGGALRIALSPNPSDGNISLNIMDKLTDKEKKLVIKVYDLSGNLKFQKETQYIKNLKINLSKLIKGDYLISVSNRSSTFTNKIIIH